jgi:hypothetical protein
MTGPSWVTEKVQRKEGRVWDIAWAGAMESTKLYLQVLLVTGGLDR